MVLRPPLKSEMSPEGDMCPSQLKTAVVEYPVGLARAPGDAAFVLLRGWSQKTRPRWKTAYGRPRILYRRYPTHCGVS